MRFCDAFNIPLVTFVDVPGFLPGKYNYFWVFDSGWHLKHDPQQEQTGLWGFRSV